MIRPNDPPDSMAVRDALAAEAPDRDAKTWEKNWDEISAAMVPRQRWERQILHKADDGVMERYVSAAEAEKLLAEANTRNEDLVDQITHPPVVMRPGAISTLVDLLSAKQAILDDLFPTRVVLERTHEEGQPWCPTWRLVQTSPNGYLVEVRDTDAMGVDYWKRAKNSVANGLLTRELAKRLS